MLQPDRSSRHLGVGASTRRATIATRRTTILRIPARGLAAPAFVSVFAVGDADGVAVSVAAGLSATCPAGFVSGTNLFPVSIRREMSLIAPRPNRGRSPYWTTQEQVPA